mmetsp:Transcript_114308/g.227462  ORF Transcript_114308/g.227462 Transcript_114308/m.227462 type:complete len:188 (+) Transcript_114308:57-620(+)
MLHSAEAADAAAAQPPKRAFTAPSALGRTSTYAMSASQQPSQEPQAASLDEEDEELEDLPAAEKEGDPLLGVMIRRTVDGVLYEAVVEEIEVGKVSKERLYRVKYTDGDLEHLTAKEVEDCRIPSNGQALAEDAAVTEAGDEDEDNGPPTAVARKPAARSGPGVQATIAKKPAAAKAAPVAKKPAKA